MEEISGVAFIFNQKFFQELREATGWALSPGGLVGWVVDDAAAVLFTLQLFLHSVLCSEHNASRSLFPALVSYVLVTEPGCSCLHQLSSNHAPGMALPGGA